VRLPRHAEGGGHPLPAMTCLAGEIADLVHVALPKARILDCRTVVEEGAALSMTMEGCGSLFERVARAVMVAAADGPSVLPSRSLRCSAQRAAVLASCVCSDQGKLP